MRAESESRLERDSRARRNRARAHLERKRRGRGTRGSGGSRGGRRVEVPTSRFARIFALALSVALGLFTSDTVLAALAGAWSGETPTVERIGVRGVIALAPREVAAATGVAPGSDRANVDVEAVREHLLDHDWIAEAAALRLPDGTLVIEVLERVPLAHVSLGSEAYAVDSRGAPFAIAGGEIVELLPHLVSAGPITVREPSAGLAEAVRIAHRLPALGLALPAEVAIAADGDPEGFTLRLPELTTRFVVGREDIDARLDELVHLLARRPELVTGSATVDLRFADQAVLEMTPAPRGPAREARTRGGVFEPTRRSARSSGSAHPSGQPG